LGVHLFFFVLVLATTSCTEIQTPPTPPMEGALPTVQLEYTDSVPQGWGRLVAVTKPAPSVSDLWFENEDGEIHIVTYTHRGEVLVPAVRVIGRQGDEQ
jgi:hypothetical protein